MPDDTGDRATVHTGSQPRFPRSIHRIGTAWEVSVFHKGQKGKDTCLPCPQASTGDVLMRAVTMLGCFPWDLKEGQVRYQSPSPMYTFYKVSTLPPLGTRLICLAQEGMGEEGRGRECSAGGK